MKLKGIYLLLEGVTGKKYATERNFWALAETTGGVQGDRWRKHLFVVVNFYSSQVCLEELDI